MQTEEELIYSIAFSYLYKNRIYKGIRLLREYGSALEVWKHLDEQKMTEALRRAEQEIKFVNQHNIECITYNSDNYPPQLKECPDAPLMLFSKGNIQINKGKMIAIVGTRSCSERGKDLTQKLVYDIAAKLPDATIISGLAYGIDIAAHRAAIEKNLSTLIIVGHGLDKIYPAIHRNDAVKALANGGIITEYISGTEPDKYNFVARDRIIAGMADAVVVVESKQKGGALITAQAANDYSRSVFAFPGRVQDETSKGCNMLIRDNKAHLILSAEDMINTMMWEKKENTTVQTEMAALLEGMTDEESKIINILKKEEDGLHINQIMEDTEISYSALISTLTMMEMKGWVKSMAGNMYRCFN
jgi:DNA processing protein